MSKTLDREFVLAESTHPELIATTIVHKAAHARIESCGIGYKEKLRPRIEAACFRRELHLRRNYRMESKCGSRRSAPWLSMLNKTLGRMRPSLTVSTGPTSRRFANSERQTG